MKAGFCTGPGQFEIRDVDAPRLAPDDVLVRVRACGICGSDLHYFTGGFPPPSVCPGHEISGEVVEVGARATVAVGAQVAVEPLVPCGTCVYCRTGDYQLCPAFRIVGNALDGGFAEFVRLPARSVFRLPDAVDAELGSLTEPLAVAVHALRLAHLAPGDRVLVIGAGTIGLMAVAAARAAGAGDVWITARHPHQRAAAASLGADRAFSTSTTAEELPALTRDRPIDAIIETVGGEADTIGAAVHLVRRAGKVVVLGIFTRPVAIDATALVVKEIRLIGSMTYGRCGTRADFERALDLLARRPEAFRALITHRFTLAEIQRAFETAADKRCGSIKVSVVADASAAQTAGM